MGFSINKQITGNKVLKNFSYVTIGNIVAQLINLLAIVKISKIFSQADYGGYTFLTVQGLLIFTLADLGIRNIVIRTIARDKGSTKDVVVNGIFIRLFSVCFFSILYYIYNRFLGHLPLNSVLLICVFSFFNCITNLFESTFWGLQKMFLPAVMNVVTSLLWFAAIFIVPRSSITINSLFIIFICTNTILTGLVYIIVLTKNKLITGTRRPLLQSSNNLLKQSWPYFVLVLLTLPYNYLTNNFLDINSNKTQIGYFNLSQKLLSPISLLIYVSLAALFPNLSNLWVTDQDKFKRLINKGVKAFFLLALAMCFFYTVFAGYIINFFFSSKYAAVIEISKMQIWFVFLMGINSIIGTIWGATNNEKLLIKSSIVNVIISVPLLYVGSKYGALGLSYGYVISFAIFEIYLWLSFKKTLNLVITQDKVLWLISIVLFLVSFFLLNEISLVLKIVISVVVILFIGLLLKKRFFNQI